MNSLNERKTASLGRCRFTIGKTGVQPTLKIQWHLQLSWGYNYQKGGLFNSFNMAYLRKKSMSCDFRLSSVEKKTLQKRRAITLFDQFRLLGNALWIQLKMTARRANWRLFKPAKRFLPRFHAMICICMVFAMFGRRGHLTPKKAWQQSKSLLPRYLRLLFTETLKNGILEGFPLTASFSCRPF